jgi:hypothetical protein
MKKDALPSKGPGPKSKYSNGNNFASHAKALRAAIHTVSGLDEFKHGRIKSLVEDLCEIALSEVAHDVKAKTAINNLHDKLSPWVNVPASVWEYRPVMGDLLNDFVDALAGGHGDFDAQICSNGSVVFVGELDGPGDWTLREDQGDIICMFRAYSPYVYFVDRKTGEVLATNGMKHAAALLINTRRQHLETADHNVWYKRFNRLSLRRRKS